MKLLRRPLNSIIQDQYPVIKTVLRLVERKYVPEKREYGRIRGRLGFCSCNVVLESAEQECDFWEENRLYEPKSQNNQIINQIICDENRWLSLYTLSFFRFCDALSAFGLQNWILIDFFVNFTWALRRMKNYLANFDFEFDGVFEWLNVTHHSTDLDRKKPFLSGIDILNVI